MAASWRYSFSAETPSFWLVLGTAPQAGVVQPVSISGEPAADGWIRLPSIPFVAEGSVQAYYPEFGGRVVEFPLGLPVSAVTNEKYLYPAGLVLHTSGPGMVYCCLTAKEDVFLEWDRYLIEEPETFSVPSRAGVHYVVVIWGRVRIGFNELGAYQIGQRTDGSFIEVEVLESNTLFFHVWERGEDK